MDLKQHIYKIVAIPTSHITPQNSYTTPHPHSHDSNQYSCCSLSCCCHHMQLYLSHSSIRLAPTLYGFVGTYLHKTHFGVPVFDNLDQAFIPASCSMRVSFHSLATTNSRYSELITPYQDMVEVISVNGDRSCGFPSSRYLNHSGCSFHWNILI